jgi:hypothetical protein
MQLPVHVKPLLNLFSLDLVVERIIPVLNAAVLDIHQEEDAWRSSGTNLHPCHRANCIHGCPLQLSLEDILMEVYIEGMVSERCGWKSLNLSLRLAGVPKLKDLNLLHVL